MTDQRLRYGMVGGGPGAFIGDVHRHAIALDDLAVIAAGCFSRSRDKSLETGRALRIPEERLYADYESMAEAESRRAEGIDFVVIVTPNAQHYPAAKAFLSRGIDVVCDKPLCFEPEEAEELAALARSRDRLFCVTYAYTGYPAVKHARELIGSGELGELRFVNAEYPQEWLAEPQERMGNRGAAWRLDPAQTGKSNCVGDIGSHVENLVSYLTGLKIARLCARLDSFVPGRSLDDSASIMVDYAGNAGGNAAGGAAGGARGLYWASQIAVGYDNALRVRIFGSKGSLHWSQENPNYLLLSKLGEPTVTLSRGRDRFRDHAQSYSRIPAGHPEGYLEAFANLYKTFITALARKKGGARLAAGDLDFPGLEAGISGVRFINACVESSRRGAVWLAP